MRVIEVSFSGFFMSINNELKIEILLEVLPYIKKFQGKVFVIKFGGSILCDNKNIKSVIEDVVFLNKIGIKTIIIHGGGKDINEELKIHNIEPKFVDGVRFTDDKTMEIAEMVLSGKVNKNLVAEANNQGLYAVGISGKDANFIKAKKKNKLGNVGEVVSVNIKIINTLIESGFIPVISPVCCDKNCKSLNVNADDVAVEIAKALKAEKLVFLTDIDVAVEIAKALKAEKLVFLTDIEGVFQDVNDKNSLISVILTKDIEKMIKSKVITGGMIPKILSCGDAIKNGINAVHIVNGTTPHSMLLEIYTDKCIGTIIKNG